MKMDGYKVTDFYVTGRGYFPFDMLRYDQCYPVSSEDAAKLSSEYLKDNICIHLRSANKMGVTPARWQSFGWTASEKPIF